MASRVLIVDDDPVECRLLQEIVAAEGYAAAGGEAALARLGRADAPPIALAILDLVMPDLDGMAVLERLRRQAIFIPVIVRATAGGIDAAVSAMHVGRSISS
jgi:DNA-binding NtrC family response regulator